MSWRIEFDPRAKRDLDGLSPDVRARIVDFLLRRVAEHPNPYALAKRLAGTSADLFRLRAGDCRLIVRFKTARMTILVVEIGNRREVYRSVERGA